MKTLLVIVLVCVAAVGGALARAAPAAAHVARPACAAHEAGSAQSTRLAWSRIDDFTYQLQDVSLRALGRSRFDLVIIDYSRDGTEATRFSAAQVARLRASPGGPKRVLAYLSIGEAEDYRWYWREVWDADHDGVPDAGAPSWLGPSNPEWPGNYKVRYWDPEWQALVFGSPDSYLAKIVAAGFDGVYLDIVDGYEYWGPDGVGELDAATAEQRMVDFVSALAGYARTANGRPRFGVFPQNGADLGRHPEYLAVVTGIGQEDTWYDGERRRPLDETVYVVCGLQRFGRAGKLVLCTDYCRRAAHIDTFYRRARSHGFVPYATVRDLDRLVVNAGHRPD